MHIGVDGYNLAMPHGTGIATYGFVLSQALRQNGDSVTGVFGIDVGQTPALREVMFFDRLDRAPDPQTRRQFRRDRRRLLRDALWPRVALRPREVPFTDQVQRKAFAQRIPAFDRVVSTARLFEIAHRHFEIYGRFLDLRIDRPPAIMHWTYPVPIRLKSARNVYTLHDLVPLRMPYTTLDRKPSYFRLIECCIDNADHICTVSDASLADIRERFPIPESRITNTYQASPMPPSIAASSAEADASMIEGVFGLARQGYYLYFGAIEPKKNIGRLIEAYLGSRIDHPLVIVGSRAWQSESELRLLPKEDDADAGKAQEGARRIIRLEHLPRELLLRLIRGARAVLFPSLFEGFGLPVLEAMQLGTPVLTSRTSSLAEVAGDAAVLVDPYDVGSIMDGLLALDRDEQLRASCSARGLDRARFFSMERYRERLSGLYNKVVSEGRAVQDGAHG